MSKFTLMVLVTVLWGLGCAAAVEARGRHHFGGGPSIGFYFGDPFFWSYRYPFYPYYYPPMIVPVPTEPPTYVERGGGDRERQPLPPNYWYYCANPAGYYPSVSQCSTDWIPVAPQPGGKP
ncbi:MAG: hypothetical protein FIA97_20205 [Methylococcaceae bacterium]|nr:hypothetical protein [Methylococcaceae bacterium]